MQRFDSRPCYAVRRFLTPVDNGSVIDDRSRRLRQADLVWNGLAGMLLEAFGTAALLDRQFSLGVSLDHFALQRPLLICCPVLERLIRCDSVHLLSAVA